jgi:hypothetical protein
MNKSGFIHTLPSGRLSWGVLAHDAVFAFARARNSRQTFFAMRQGPVAHDKDTLSCTVYIWCTTKTFSIYVYFNP